MKIGKYEYPFHGASLEILFSAGNMSKIVIKSLWLPPKIVSMQAQAFNKNNVTAEGASGFSRAMEGNFFQSLDFQRVLQQIGWRTVFLRLKKREYPASVLSFAPHNRRFFSYFRVLYGPCVHSVEGDIDPTILDSLLKNLCSRVKQYGTLFLHVRTPFPFPYGYEVFRKNGFAMESVKGEYSVFIDLRRDLAVLWKEVKRFARRNVKKAVEKGVEVKGVETETELRRFYRIYVETAVRRGFRPYPYRLFEAFWTQLEPKGTVKFFIAWWKKKPVAGVLNTFYKEESVPYIACSLNRFWNLRPNHLLFWHSIKWSKEIAGSSVFKLYHLPSKRERVQGIDYYTFKTCFGGRLAEECAFYHKVFPPANFEILQVLNKLSKSRLAKVARSFLDTHQL